MEYVKAWLEKNETLSTPSFRPTVCHSLTVYEK